VVTGFDELRQRLEKEKERLLKELEHLRSDAPLLTERREGSPFGKKEEEATETFEFGKRLALEEQTRNLLAEVEHALEKHERGTYGLCDACGQPIDPERLEVLPQANLCLNCKVKSKGKFHLR
jgi:RNA polymerase-binding protein DksA